MKILQLISCGGFFGAENMVLELSRQLSLMDVDNTVGVFENKANPHMELFEKAADNNLRVAVFKCGGRFDPNTLRAIGRFAGENKINVIHSHGYKANIYGFISATMHGKPIVATCHNWIADDARARIYYGIEKMFLKRFDRVAAVSNEIGAELIKRNVKKTNISIIGNGIDTDRFAAAGDGIRHEFKIARGTKVIGTVARFAPEKGLSIFLKAAGQVCKTVARVKFMLVGTGNLREELAISAEELGLGAKVIFTGLRDDLPRLYAAMDIFVLPSLKEGLPMALLEAMAARKPVIASRVGGVPMVVRDEEEGLLVNPGNPKELALAIIRLLKDEDLASRMAVNANRKVAEEFSSKAMCAKYMGIYEELVNNLRP